MEKAPVLDPDCRVFTISDVKRLYIRVRKKVFYAAAIGSACAFALSILKAPTYKIEATFKEGVEHSEGNHVLKDFMGGLNAGGSQPQAVILMKSYSVLKPLVEHLGLQATIPQQKWIVSKILKRIRENVKAEWQSPLDDLDLFEFSNVKYEGETKLSGNIKFQDAEQFEVSISDEIVLGIVGKPISFQNVTFTIAKVPQRLRIGYSYPLQICPWIDTARKIRDKLQIIQHKSNKSVYELNLFHRDRMQGVQIVNQLMAHYRQFLKEDHDQLAEEQLAYLEEQQKHLYDKMGHVFNEHAAYMNTSIDKRNLFGFEQDIYHALDPLKLMSRKMMEIDIDLKRLESYSEDKIIVTDEGPFFRQLVSLFQMIQDLKQQRDLLELSLQHNQTFAEGENRLEARRGELCDVRMKKEALLNLLDAVDGEASIASFGINRPLALWAERVQRTQEPEEREDLAEYLENYTRLLSMREKMLQERFLYTSDAPVELEGIDLETARLLFADYNTKLDKTEAQMRHLMQLKDQIKESSFNISSLSAILDDPVSQNLIKQASEIDLKLKDEKYHSSKEGERWQADLDLQKKILSEHLEQLCAVEKLNEELIREKLFGLQQVSLDCINRRLSVLTEQIADSVKNQKIALIQEKELLAEKLQELRCDAKELPEQWKSAKWLEMKTEMGVRMIQTITQAVESKTISHKLHQVESKPLDHAQLPYLPQKPSLLLSALLGAFAVGFFTFFYLLLRTILNGFPTSPEKLQAMRFPFLGSLSPFCDGPAVERISMSDLELIRQMGLFLETRRGKTVALAQGKGPDYSYSLAENLSRISLKTIILRCDFGSKFQKEDLPGIVQIWKKEISDLPIRKGKGFDFLTAGGYSPYGAEILQSQPFSQLLELLKKNYDIVFLLSRAPLESAEISVLLRLSDQAIVTVQEEPTEQLTPFINWAYIDGHCRLNFIASHS